MPYIFASSPGDMVRQQNNGGIADYRSASSPIGAGIMLHHDRGAGSLSGASGYGVYDAMRPRTAFSGGLDRSRAHGWSRLGQTAGPGGSNSPSPGRNNGDGQEPGSVFNPSINRMRSNSFTHRMQHSMMRGIDKMREFIYSGSSSNRSERERNLRVNNTTDGQNRLRQSSVWDSLEGSDGQGNDNSEADMDDADPSEDNALPRMPPEGR